MWLIAGAISSFCPGRLRTPTRWTQTSPSLNYVSESVKSPLKNQEFGRLEGIGTCGEGEAVDKMDPMSRD